MNLYAESSAVLAWLLDEARGPAIRKTLAVADSIVTSELTLVECDRALHRAATAGAITTGFAAEHHARLAAIAEDWMILRITPAIVERARRPFPEEPIRTLDALHIASALTAAGVLPALAVLSLDQRVRKVARALGLDVTPE